MSSRYIAPLLIASALAFACGPLSHSTEVEATPDRPAADAVADTVDGAVAASLVVDVGAEVGVTLEVANAAGHQVELDFADGQTHDVAILDAAGREVWRWSAGRLFTTAVQTKLLGADETTSYVERWAPGEHRGTFTAVATLRSGRYPVELRHGFTIE
jgi:hypothetical protein